MPSASLLSSWSSARTGGNRARLQVYRSCRTRSYSAGGFSRRTATRAPTSRTAWSSSTSTSRRELSFPRSGSAAAASRSYRPLTTCAPSTAPPSPPYTTPAKSSIGRNPQGPGRLDPRARGGSHSPTGHERRRSESPVADAPQRSQQRGSTAVSGARGTRRSTDALPTSLELELRPGGARLVVPRISATRRALRADTAFPPRPRANRPRSRRSRHAIARQNADAVDGPSL